MSLDDLYQHAMFTAVTQDNAELQKALGIGLMDDLDDSIPVDEVQFYVMRVGFTLAHAIGWVEQLYQAVHFMEERGQVNLKSKERGQVHFIRQPETTSSQACRQRCSSKVRGC
ncbi:hypothetical protein VDG09_07445 [Xanthomonas campestris pv. raphani]|uniref:hypothetical protein n=1 Tax=Xanthomonas campestris TaxID=339 RepID=UPI002B236F58|nr:hypothetical protein [Xanthomonas campestris]MEA9827485.1 hypothetical protein [Xanthomonas campestris pv. raphani]